MRNRRVTLINRPTDIPLPEHFSLDEVEIPALADGEFLVRNLFLSVDPAQRGWALAESNYSNPVPLGAAMRALAIGEVIASLDPEVNVGERLYGWFDWQEFCVCGRDKVLRYIDTSVVPLSGHASLLGINGMAAYLGLVQSGRPQEGDAILVSTAAGSVGSFVGQIARNLGCHPYGLTSTAEKVKVCTERYGYECAIPYSDQGWTLKLANVAQKGFNVFFDNVGGRFLDTALRQMAVGGRIVQCGTASVSSWANEPSGPRNEREILVRRLNWAGFVVFDHIAQFDHAAKVLTRWFAQGKIVYDEDICYGLEDAPSAISGLYAGSNNGKKLISLQ
jgi:NADPH-dependent curcumin reductase